jgi:tetratricopeptide (TPR) repeat protein
MGLDWAAPPFPPEAEVGPVGPLTVDVRAPLPTGPALTREQKSRSKIECYRVRFEASRNSADACNDLAWVLLTAPESLRDVSAAVPLAERAAKLDPKNAVYANTLGLAYYRAGRCRDAVDVLRPNLDRQADGYLAYDLYILALSRHRLGDVVSARDCFAYAVRWVRIQPGLTADELDELKEFRAEAEHVLGIVTEAAPPPREKK